MGGTTTIATLCTISAILTALICYGAERFGQAAALIDRPDGRLKIHDTETPLIGGLAMLVPSFALSFFYLTQVTVVPYLMIVLGASTAMLVVGVLDDRMGLSPIWRLAALILIVLAVFAADPLSILRALRFGLTDFDIGVSLGLLAVPVTALMVIGFVNAANLADGMNGQLLGSVMIWCLLLSRYLGAEPGVPYALIFCSAAVTLIFNLRGRLFSGSAGAYAASLFVALGTISAYRRGGALSAIEPILWFWLPVLDCLRLMATRINAGKSPFFGDRNHIHHILQDSVGTRFALPAYLGLLAAPGATAALTNDRLIGCFMLAACLCLYSVLVLKRREQKSAPAQSTAAPVPTRSILGTVNINIPPKMTVQRPLARTAASGAEERAKLTTFVG